MTSVTQTAPSLRGSVRFRETWSHEGSDPPTRADGRRALPPQPQTADLGGGPGQRPGGPGRLPAGRRARPGLGPVGHRSLHRHQRDPGRRLFLAVALPVGTIWSIRRGRVIHDWLLSGAPAGEAARNAVLRLPLEFALVSAVFWGLGAVGFTALNHGDPAGRVLVIAVTNLLGGFSTSAFSYLLAERIIRPTTALALAGDPPLARSGRASPPG